MKNINKISFKIFFMVSIFLLCLFVSTSSSYAAGISIDLGTESAGNMGSLELLFLFVILAIAPSLLIMMTSFTRIVIVFSFLRNALGLQQTPPNQVIIGISLFLSLFIMQPVISDINTGSIEPYMNKQITDKVAIERMQEPIKEFMLKQTKDEDLNLFLSLSNDNKKVELTEETLKTIGLDVVIPSFITSELKRAFTIGFLLFLPFLVIDMIVSSTLMSMGMVMLPPTVVSLPFKVMLFVVIDGWSLVMEMLVKSFH